MVLFEVPNFDGRRDESPWVFVKWLNEIEKFFDRSSFSYTTRVRFAKRKLIGRTQVFWEDLEYRRFLKQEPAIIDWEDMKAKLQDEYLQPYF